MARQKHLEKSAYDVALERLQQQVETLDSLGIHNPALNTSTLQKWMWEWHTKLRERIQEEIKAIFENEEGKKRTTLKGRSLGPGGSGEMLSPYLSLVNPERLSLITIMEIMRLQGSSGVADGMKTARALISVGKAVEMEYKAQMIKKPDNVADSKSAGGNLYSHAAYKNLRDKRLAVSKEIEGEERSLGWSQVTRSKIGGILVDCLMEVAEVERTAKLENGEKVSEMQPAFHHAYEYLRGSRLGVIRLNPVVSERLATDPLKDTLHPRHLPMLVKPQPWVSHNVGGYLYSKTSVMRFKDSIEQQIYLKEASKHGQMELVYAGLDVLASTPWKINKKVFEVVLRTWNSGERLGKVPPAMYDGPEPVQPQVEELADMKKRSYYLVRQKAYNQAKANNHSDRCSVNYKLEIARAFLNDEFYFPHNLDFRGRAYPVPAHLNHIGDDLCRGLLTFAEAKPLGVRGLRWLKIHIANLYGYDKANFDDRVNWVDEHLDQIYQTATRLLDDPATKAWWLEASDPWQFLAASIELHDALESGNPEAFESSLPVHQDGTCNGLQHYAALGGDVQGARQVNLEASDKPSDVYSHVGAMVEEAIAKDCESGDKYALMLKGKITRKVVKQTVMTTVYGVTFIGAREQIEKQLKDRKDIPEEECWSAAAYLARLVLGCIGNLFKGAQSIQTWLNLSARLVAKSIPEARIPELMAEAAAAKKGQLPMNRLKKEQMTSVIWTTPLGLPIVQPYRKIARKQIDTAIQTVYISDPNRLAEVNSAKQASAFPPNYIHSLDATHMMLTALECRKKNLTFASVHDSYWTHAADIDEMSSTIRDTFIALHSSDVLGQLRREFLQRYHDYKIPLINLSGTNFATKLYNAGSRIYATPEQASSLASLKDLVVIGQESESTIDESRAPKDEKTVKQLLDELEAEAEKERKVQQKEAVVKLMGKFVNMIDLLPPLPQKGEFDVERIKKSQYFFS
ncbi:hypothetical protein AGABI1DRAFT_69188 [Agaricus bisporus var. burnettii JB137-S8]|uniref:DNA-directed RNA polymerase n=1 Tax=Agaricus bisporus var. burnettii (strain JB137-S8 / ATCC MYA-4627 / FGSC 10392) TaxID=597362 RepID=K5X592_AGABU|nr:uncharacterized protein AGABI1DRAFT_69188 [Agaricus bisporus var. burnettii JB137-S8]EKM83036.1 hypothetical protein AGABI1DRAFT_69188 [Agaricus bisporus var. burnettii JB137-S8]